MVSQRASPSGTSVFFTKKSTALLNLSALS